jgi:nucleoside 2-deoxyribosyltransferase
MTIVIAGGVYVERCLTPNRTSLLGSGGRAAAALSELSPGVKLHTFHPRALVLDAQIAFAAFGIETVFHDSSAVIGFEYLHPLSSPRIYPVPLPQAGTVEVDGDVILRFGCLEGDFCVRGRRVVYDPQSGSAPSPFRQNGSHGEELSIVLNRTEAELLTGESDPDAAAKFLRQRELADVVVIKMGAAGAIVFEVDARTQIPAYNSSAVDKIGSGDVFSAAFAHFWGERGIPAAEAADIASRYTSGYVEDRCLPLTKEPPSREPVTPPSKIPRVYLGGPFFTTPQIWMIEEARSGLSALGAKVFSPMHDVGFGKADIVARRDLNGLENCDAMLALLSDLDPGTLFEVGHARSRNIPVVALLQRPRDQDATMLTGTDCDIVSDLATALYRVVWAAS